MGFEREAAVAKAVVGTGWSFSTTERGTGGREEVDAFADAGTVGFVTGTRGGAFAGAGGWTGGGGFTGGGLLTATGFAGGTICGFALGTAAAFDTTAAEGFGGAGGFGTGGVRGGTVDARGCDRAVTELVGAAGRVAITGAVCGCGCGCGAGTTASAGGFAGGTRGAEEEEEEGGGGGGGGGLGCDGGKEDPEEASADGAGDVCTTGKEGKTVVEGAFRRRSGAGEEAPAVVAVTASQRRRALPLKPPHATSRADRLSLRSADQSIRRRRN